MERISLSVNGFRFTGLSAGPKSGPLVLFLHGFPQFADAWTAVVEATGSRGFHAVAVDQRGYSPGARPINVEEYALAKLAADAIGFADSFGAEQFHLVGHDWGGAVAWATAAEHVDRLLSLTVLSTPHPAALFAALQRDQDQQVRSAYFALFTAPNGAAEKFLLADDAKALRDAYMNKVLESDVNWNIERFKEGGALTAALNWYRAMVLNAPIGTVNVKTMYLWGDQDQALGKTAAFATAQFCNGPYRFEVLEGKSHWLVEECTAEIMRLMREQIEPAAI